MPLATTTMSPGANARVESPATLHAVPAALSLPLVEANAHPAPAVREYWKMRPMQQLPPEFDTVSVPVSPPDAILV